MLACTSVAIINETETLLGQCWSSLVDVVASKTAYAVKAGLMFFLEANYFSKDGGLPALRKFWFYCVTPIRQSRKPALVQNWFSGTPIGNQLG